MTAVAEPSGRQRDLVAKAQANLGGGSKRLHLAAELLERIYPPLAYDLRVELARGELEIALKRLGAAMDALHEVISDG